MAWTFMLVSVSIAYFIWNVISLLANYRSARQIGLPIVISPVSPLQPFWALFHRHLPLKHLQTLPWGLGTFARCSYMGWSFQDKCAIHREIGDVFVLVNPGINEVVVADPEVAHSILARRKEFIKPAAMYEQMDVFGPSVNTCEGDDWQRHRRITAPSFSERTSDLAWNEALYQAKDMLEDWLRHGRKGTADTAADTALLTLHVLSSAGFGQKHPFHAGVQNPRPGFTMTYRDSLQLILQNIILLAIFPRILLRSAWLPRKFRQVGEAAHVFGKYMEEMLFKERHLAAQHESGAENLMSALVRASDADRKSKDTEAPIQGLTDTEIFGNIFMYNLAGHETTANTVFCAIVLLAAHPSCQEWMVEEISQVFKTDDKMQNWDYEAVFPKLKRCLAVMYETLRLYGSVVFIPKTTSFHPQTISSHGRSYIVPPKTFVTVNVQAVQTDSRSWGSDALVWRPNRWLTSREDKMGNESWVEPSDGTFLAWADGPRSCPGRKFAQVEFVATLTSLFRNHQVEPVPLEGESAERARERLMDMANDAAISAITLQMQHPRSVSLAWKER